MSVPIVPLRNLLTQRRGVQVVPSTTYPMAGVFGFGKGLIVREPILGSETKYKTLTPLKTDDLVYSKVKAFEGAITVVPTAGHGRFVSPEFPVFEVSDLIVADYLQHLLSWDEFVGQLRARSSGIGARRERVHPAVLLAMHVPLPDLSEQWRISAHLDGIRRALRIMAESRSEDFRPIEAALSRLPWDTPLRLLVYEDCDEVELDQNVQYRQLGVFGKGRGIIDRGTFFGSETKYTRMLRVRAGQVVLSRLKAFEGAVAIAHPDHDGALVSKEFPTFTLAGDVDPLFLRGVLTSAAFEEHLRANSIGLGARRERVDAQRFLSIKVPLPPLDAQRRVGRAVECSIRIDALRQRSSVVGGAILSAARNEVFSALR